METIISALMARAGAKMLFNSTTGKPLFGVVATRTSALWKEVARVYPQILYASLSDALTDFDDGSNVAASYADQQIATIYVAPGTYTSTVKQVIKDTQSGLRIFCERGSEFTTATALTAGDGLIEIEGRNVALVGFPRLSNTNATQTGSALIIGGSASGEGDGIGAYIENLEVLGSTTATDWVKPVIVRGASNVTFKDCIVYGSTATTRIISVESGNSRNSTNVKFINTRAKAITDSGNTCVPLTIDASQTGGVISGGEYTTDGSGKAIIITADDWTLDGAGLAGSTAAVGAGNHIDLVTATKIRVGQFYVKDLDGTTPASLFDQTNV